MIKFSTKGFRTLCFGLRVIDESYFKTWLSRYEQAKLDQIRLGVSKQHTTKGGIKVLYNLQDEIESELFLLGATALEDKL